MNPQDMQPGVDVSSFQGSPGQWAAEAGAIRWAGVKLTELQPSGTRYVNPDAAADWAYLQEHELGRIAYLFAHPATAPADTVRFFAGELNSLGLADDDAIAVDLEVADGIGPAAVDAWALDVTRRLHATFGRVPLLYTYLSFAEAGNCASLGHLPLWMSDPSSPAGHPRIPKPWTAFAIHQHATGGAIDRDLAAYPTMAAMRAALGKPPPPEEDMKLIQDVTLATAVAGKPAEIPPDGKPVLLKWSAVTGKPSLLGPGGEGAAPGAGAVISAVNVHVGTGGRLRITLAESAAPGAEPEMVSAEFSEAGGWVQFTAPFAARGGTFMVTATNFGPEPADLTEGTWRLVR